MDTFTKNNYELFLHMVGGHAFIINIGEGRIIKNANKNEIQFYEYYKNYKFDIYELFPEYYGIIDKNKKEYKMIEEFFSMCDNLFFELISENICNLKNSIDINVEKDDEFKKKLQQFLTDKKEEGEKKINLGENNIENISNYNPYYEKLKENLISFGENKLKWILFWYVKWRHSFLKNDFIILEDLTKNMSIPAVIDFKLGFKQKISKKDLSIKTLPTSSSDLGFRIMGLQVKLYQF
jgi:hypothetical protein